MRYRPASGPDPASFSWTKLQARVTAPLGGSKLLFPQRLAQVLDPARREAACDAIPSAHARWFFGPDLVFWTDPSTLTHRLHDRVSAGAADIRLGERFVDAGDWTDAVVPLDSIPEHRETVELVRYGARYPDMPAFRTMLARIKKARPVQRYRMRLDSEEKLHAYFAYFLGLIDSIRESGFQEQSALKRPVDPAGLGVRGKYAYRQRNAGVAIGADGRLLRFLGGRHRTAIAQALGLAAIPVEARLVHVDWLAAVSLGAPPVEALRSWIRRNSLQPTAE